MFPDITFYLNTVTAVGVTLFKVTVEMIFYTGKSGVKRTVERSTSQTM